MRKIATIAAVLALAGTTAFAQDRVSRTESNAQTKSETSTDAAGRTSTKTTSTSTSVTYEDRLQKAYRAAGVSDPDIKRLVAIDSRVVDARRTKASDRIKTYYTEESQIVTPAQQ